MCYFIGVLRAGVLRRECLGGRLKGVRKPGVEWLEAHSWQQDYQEGGTGGRIKQDSTNKGRGDRVSCG